MHYGIDTNRRESSQGPILRDMCYDARNLFLSLQLAAFVSDEKGERGSLRPANYGL